MTEQRPQSNPFGGFFGLQEDEETGKTSLGSGVIVDPRGLVVTNEHVVASVGHELVERCFLALDPDLAREPEDVARLGDLETRVLILRGSLAGPNIIALLILNSTIRQCAARDSWLRASR